MEQWYLTYQNCFTTFKRNKNIFFVCYEHLCSSEKYWLDILEKLNIKVKYNFEFSESYKNISLHIDEEIMNKGLSLYSELSVID